MPKYLVIKSLELRFECEAANAEEAESQCIDADEVTDMTIADCQYHVTQQRHPLAGLDWKQIQTRCDEQEIEPAPFTQDAWQEAVAQGNTVRGYWDWVVAQIEEYDHVADEDE